MNYKTFFKFGAWALLVTGCTHLLSFVGNRAPANGTECRLMDLLANYRFDPLPKHR